MHFPNGLHLRLRWQCLSRLQFKAEGPDFQAELIPVHSPLLRESYLVSYPPLTYMLKFSGFADLASCLEVKVGAKASELRNAASQSRERGQTQPIHCEVRRRLTHALHASSSAPSCPFTRKEERREANPNTHDAKRRARLVRAPRRQKEVDTEAGMLSGISRKRRMRSGFYWLTEICNSQCLSHFAAPFIVV
jgi:hypothetical protein